MQNYPGMWLVYLLLLCGLTTIYAQTNCTVEGSVRLEGLEGLDGLSSDHAGRVEICHNGVWGTVCGESDTIPWSEKNAQVVCRHLGYSGTLNSILQHTLLVSSRVSDPVPVHYRDVSCFGNEVTLLNCPGIAEVGPSDNCPHDNDVAITCRSTFENSTDVGDVRLTGDPINGHGAVQLFDESFGWIDVCEDSTWGDDDANVVCRQLGYESGTARSYSLASSSRRTATFFSCDPNIDETINDCTYSTQSSCFSFQRGGVECSSSLLPEGSIRLAGANVFYEGRVEILYNGRWGTICNTDWDNIGGEVACVQLGLGNDVVNTFTFDLYSDPSNVKPIWLGSIRCSLNDEQLSDCDLGNPIGYADNCLRRAEVDCGFQESGSSSSSDGLSSGAITGIIFAAIFIVFFVLPFGYAFGKDYWRKRNQYSCWHAITCPCRWVSELNCSCNRRRRTAVTTTPVTTTPASPQPPPTSRSGGTSSESEPEEEPEPEPEQETEFTKVPPPSYRMASSFPTADPSAPAPPTDLPPPYPGPQATPYPPANPYPPAPYPSGPILPNYPPPANFAYPPPANFAYPPTLDPAYPPPTVPAGASTDELPYPPDGTQIGPPPS